ncbi:class I SAM-dependent methyltransferase [Enterovibrio sp. Hal110]
MDEHSDIWRKFYEKALLRPHLKRTEFVVRLNESRSNVAIDCGCGTGSDIAFLEKQSYQVYGFDVNPEAIAICRDRFQGTSLVEISEASFESYDYPTAGIVLANSSLFFADPSQFDRTWDKIKSSIEIGGVFAGDFMGEKDSWASNYRSPTTPLSERAVRALFSGFEIVRFFERDENAKTSLGKVKHWHTYSVVAVRTASDRRL